MAKKPTPSEPDGEDIADTQRKRSLAIEAMGVEDFKQTTAGDVAEGTPVNTVQPMASGVTSPDGVVECTVGEWDHMLDDPHSYSFRWFRDDDAIPDAVGASYAVTDDDKGAMLSCLVKATNAVGDHAVLSNAIGPVV